MSQLILCEFICEPTSMRHMCRRCGSIIHHYQVIEGCGMPRMVCANQADSPRPEFSGVPYRKHGSVTGRLTPQLVRSEAIAKMDLLNANKKFMPTDRTNELIGQEGGRFDQLYLEEG